MNKKAIALALALAGATTVVWAQQDKPAEGKPSFTERKQHMLERMDQRIQAMQKARDCLAQAQDEQAARACRPHHGPRQGAHEGPMGHEHMGAMMGGEHMAEQEHQH